ncbi:MAG: hypothetical protein R3257_07445 [bacterium]|nr:hypothetical protein [bacterium]
MRSLKIFLAFILTLGMGFSLGATEKWDDSLYKLASPYKKVFSKYTKKGAKYSFGELTTVYKAFVTYHSPEFLQAVNKEFTKLYPDGPSTYAEVLKVGLEAPGQTEFFIGLYARDRGLRKLSGKKSLWELSLLVGKEVIHPLSVEEVKLTTFHYKFYPYLTRKWFTGYRVVFPFDHKNSPQKEMTLVLSTVRGSERMEFPLQ